MVNSKTDEVNQPKTKQINVSLEKSNVSLSVDFRFAMQ